MRELDLTEMENIEGGNDCETGLTALSIAAGAASWYAAAVFGPIGGIVMYGISIGASLGTYFCD